MFQQPEKEQCSTQPGILGVPWFPGELVTVLLGYQQRNIDGSSADHSLGRARLKY